MGDAKDRERAQLARHVGKLMRTRQDLRREMKVIADDGSYPVVVTLLTDRVSDLFALIRRNHPHGANVIAGDDKGFVALAVSHDEAGVAFGEQETDCPVHGDCEVGMLVAYAMVHPGTPVRCQMSMSGYGVEASRPVTA